MTPKIGLLAAGLVFVAFLVFKMFRPAGPRDEAWHEARRRLADAKRRAGDRSASATDRAAALRDASVASLEGLARPSLAASYARRAEKLDPEDPEAVGLLALSLKRAERYRALERFLWRRLADDQHMAGPGYERALAELLALYEGPMRRPEMATAIRRMRGA